MGWFAGLWFRLLVLSTEPKRMALSKTLIWVIGGTIVGTALGVVFYWRDGEIDKVILDVTKIAVVGGCTGALLAVAFEKPTGYTSA